MFMLQQRLKHIKSRLKDWNKKEFGNIFKAKREVEQKLQGINQIIITDGFTEERETQADSLRKEWEDRSHNRISKLRVVQVKNLVSHKEMECFLVQHFLNITEEPLLDKSRFIKNFTKYIPKLVTREDNHNLNRLVSEDEVSEVINEMQNGKSPGLDGFNVDLFKAC
eukprot:PITA_11389